MHISAAIQLQLISYLLSLRSISHKFLQSFTFTRATFFVSLCTSTIPALDRHKRNYKTRSAARKSAQLRKGVTNKYANKNGKIPGYTQCFSKVSKHYAHHDYNVRGSAKRA